MLREIKDGEGEAVDRAAAILAQKVAEGRLIHVIGPGGHSNMAVEEVLDRFR